jgi:type II secretory pathway predicted ATPase ExeA
MVNQFFGFREQPFGVTPDPRYLYLGPGHREALASLVYGIEANRGFLALIAHPGMGKTTLLVHLLEKFRSSARTAFLFQTQCNSRELLRFLLAEFGIESKEDDLVRMHDQFNRFLTEQSFANKRVIVVIDEAQNLEPSVLETIRLLSNFETPRAKLLQIILAGQPELATKLASPSLSQFRQRIASFNGLDPLAPQEVSRFIDHRLQVARYQGPPLFSDEAKAMIAELSEGIPRNINSLCFGALSLACGLQRKTIDTELVHEVFGDHDLRKLTSHSKTVAVHHHFATWSSQWADPKLAWSSQAPLRPAESGPAPTEVVALSDTQRDFDRGNHEGDITSVPENDEATRPGISSLEATLQPAEASPALAEVFAVTDTQHDRDEGNHDDHIASGLENNDEAPRPLVSSAPVPLRIVEASPEQTEVFSLSDTERDLIILEAARDVADVVASIHEAPRARVSSSSTPLGLAVGSPTSTEAVIVSDSHRDLDRGNLDGDIMGGGHTEKADRLILRKSIPSLLSRVVGFAVLVLLVGSGVTKVAAPALEMANLSPLPKAANEPSANIVKIADTEAVPLALAEAQPKEARHSIVGPVESGKPVNEGSSTQEIQFAVPVARIARPLSNIENWAALGMVKSSDTEAVRVPPTKSGPEPEQGAALDPAELWKRVAQGSVSAEISLATLYLDGSATVEQNCEQAHQLLVVASRTGSKVASDLLNGKYLERCQ